VVRTDGLKLIFSDGSWVCYRLSGTEPVVRVMVEAQRQEDARRHAQSIAAAVQEALGPARTGS